ncbi:MAG: hypothetical protein WBE38_00340 [Terracidiphilus sp.]|jgi:hypothetical protein
MAARRIGGSILRGRSRPAGGWLCALVLVVLCAAGLELHFAQAQAAQTAEQPQAQPGQQSDAQPADQSTQADQDNQADQDGKAADEPDPQSYSLDGHRPDEPADPPTSVKPDSPADSQAEKPSAETPSPGPPDTPAEHLAPAPAANPPQAAAVAPVQPAEPPAIQMPTDPRQRQVARECADLLKMATDLKAAVDKSNKDELSVDVVRKAGEIEQYARKVKDGTSLTAGKE